MSVIANPLSWFEIPVSDIQRAIAFYEYVFQVTLEKHRSDTAEMAWFPMDGYSLGAPGGLVMRPGHMPTDSGVTIYLSTKEVTPTLKRAEEMGGTIVHPSRAIGEYGFTGFIKDTEGNTIGVHSRHHP